MSSVSCVVIGDKNVGKTSILQTLRRETKGTLISTLGTEDFYVTKSVKTFNFSEAAPSEETIVRGDIFLVCYSIGDLQSLNNVFEKWMPFVSSANPQSKCIILGTKNDLRYKSNALAYDFTWEQSLKWKETKKSMNKKQTLWRTKKVLPLFKSLSFCPTTNENYFETLPNEVILLIFDYLDTPDLGRLAQTCKLFSYLAHDFSIWGFREKKRSAPNALLDESNKDLFGFGRNIYAYHTCNKSGAGVPELLDLVFDSKKNVVSTQTPEVENRRRRRRRSIFSVFR